MWSNTQRTEKNNKLKKKNNKTDQNWKNYELTSTLKVSKQPKDSVTKMNIMLRKQERTARHKSNTNIVQLCLRKLHDLYNILLLWPFTELDNSRQPEGHKTLMRPVQALFKRTQGGHLIKRTRKQSAIVCTLKGIGKEFLSELEIKHNVRKGIMKRLPHWDYKKLLSKQGSQARSEVCKETINKDKNFPPGTKKLLDAMEWPEGIDNWKGIQKWRLWLLSCIPMRYYYTMCWGFGLGVRHRAEHILQVQSVKSSIPEGRDILCTSRNVLSNRIQHHCNSFKHWLENMQEETGFASVADIRLNNFPDQIRFEHLRTYVAHKALPCYQ